MAEKTFWNISQFFIQASVWIAYGWAHNTEIPLKVLMPTPSSSRLPCDNTNKLRTPVVVWRRQSRRRSCARNPCSAAPSSWGTGSQHRYRTQRRRASPCPRSCRSDWLIIDWLNPREESVTLLLFLQEWLNIDWLNQREKSVTLPLFLQEWLIDYWLIEPEGEERHPALVPTGVIEYWLTEPEGEECHPALVPTGVIDWLLIDWTRGRRASPCSCSYRSDWILIDWTRGRRVSSCLHSYRSDWFIIWLIIDLLNSSVLLSALTDLTVLTGAWRCDVERYSRSFDVVDDLVEVLLTRRRKSVRQEEDERRQRSLTSLRQPPDVISDVTYTLRHSSVNVCRYSTKGDFIVMQNTDLVKKLFEEKCDQNSTIYPHSKLHLLTLKNFGTSDLITSIPLPPFRKLWQCSDYPVYRRLPSRRGLCGVRALSLLERLCRRGEMNRKSSWHKACNLWDSPCLGWKSGQPSLEVRNTLCRKYTQFWLVLK